MSEDDVSDLRLKNLTQFVDISIDANEALSSIVALTREIDALSDRSQSIAAASEEMVASVANISSNSEAAAEDARNANAAALEGMRAAGRAVDAMQGVSEAVADAAEKVDALADASTEIGGIVDEIEAIAKQTNLLALNATIEAARAGDVGKGFAVVASEVKNLANQTAKATEDIRRRIETLLTEMAAIVSVMERGGLVVEEGKSVIEDTRGNMDYVSGQVTAVTGKMEDISNILGQQREASTEVSQGVVSIAGMAARNAEEIQHVVDAMDRADDVIQKSLSDLSDLKSNAAVCTVTQSDHVTFKKQVMETICGRRELLPEDLPDHRSCNLGKWYYGAAGDDVKAHPAYREMEAPHEEVHRHGKEALRHYYAGDWERAIAEAHNLELASQQVIEHLKRLRDDVP